MPRFRLALLLVGALGCASTGSIQGPAPEQAPAQEPAAPVGQPGAPEVAANPIPAPARVPTVDSSQVSEIAQELKLEADSAADEQALDQLADASSQAPDSAPDVALPVTWDIDVVRWGEHDRVQYWLRFFQGVGRERFQVWLDRMPRYEPMIRARLQAASMPTDLVYLALIESGFSNTAVSRSRAVGMWQFMRGTGKEYGLRIDSWVDERRDPVKATGAALRFLSDLYDRFGSYYLAAAAYNAGGGKISGPDSPGYDAVAGAVVEVMDELSRKIIRDGEGATKMVDVVVEGAPDDAAADAVARSIGNSPLFKCALAGADPLGALRSDG